MDLLKIFLEGPLWSCGRFMAPSMLHFINDFQYHFPIFCTFGVWKTLLFQQKHKFLPFFLPFDVRIKNIAKIKQYILYGKNKPYDIPIFLHFHVRKKNIA